VTAHGELNIFRENINEVWKKSAAADFAGPKQ
jgi:hypothetical protein